MNVEKLMKHVVPFFLGQDTFARYKMSKRPRGLCYIINNINFQQAGQVRHGAEIDERKLKELFRDDLFFKVEGEKDLKSYDMGRVAAEVAQKVPKESDAFVFIIMSHGGHKEVIQGVDGNTLPIENLMNEFSPRKCPALKNKPKLFIIQSCRGSRKSNVSTDMSDVDYDPDFLPDSTLSKGVCPFEADFLLAFSTAPDYVAHRNKSGSPFVQVCSIGRTGYSLLRRNLRNFRRNTLTPMTT